MTAALLALKINVSSLRGAREGVPRLTELLVKHDVKATFFFSFGPDRSGRAFNEIFHPGGLRRVRRLGGISHYGWPGCAFGTALPAPMLGRRAADIMLATREAGFECGVLGWDTFRWQKLIATATNAWTDEHMRFAHESYTEIFGNAPTVIAAAHMRMNRHAFRLAQQLGYTYASDGRGSTPYLPIVRGEPVGVIQLPTTLPTLAHALGDHSLTEREFAAHVLDRSSDTATPHVYTADAELEGRRWLSTLEALIEGWKAQAREICAISTYGATLDQKTLPHCTVDFGDDGIAQGKRYAAAGN